MTIITIIIAGSISRLLSEQVCKTINLRIFLLLPDNKLGHKFSVESQWVGKATNT